jgi:hypothetical protein
MTDVQIIGSLRNQLAVTLVREGWPFQLSQILLHCSGRDQRMRRRQVEGGTIKTLQHVCLSMDMTTVLTALIPGFSSRTKKVGEVTSWLWMSQQPTRHQNPEDSFETTNYSLRALEFK